MDYNNGGNGINDFGDIRDVPSFCESKVFQKQKYRMVFPEELRDIMSELPNQIQERIEEIEIEYYSQKIDPTYEVLELLCEKGVIGVNIKENIVSSINREKDFEIEEKICEKFEKFSGNSTIVQSDQLKNPLRPVTKQNIVFDFEKQVEELFALLNRVKTCYNGLAEKHALDEVDFVKTKLKDFKIGIPEIKNSINRLRKNIEKENLIKQEETRLISYVQEVEYILEEVINRHKNIEESVYPSLFRKKVKVVPMLEIIEEQDISREYALVNR